MVVPIWTRVEHGRGVGYVCLRISSRLRCPTSRVPRFKYSPTLRRTETAARCRRRGAAEVRSTDLTGLERTSKGAPRVQRCGTKAAHLRSSLEAMPERR